MFARRIFPGRVFPERQFADDLELGTWIEPATGLRVRRVAVLGKCSFCHDAPIMPINEVYDPDIFAPGVNTQTAPIDAEFPNTPGYVEIECWAAVRPSLLPGGDGGGLIYNKLFPGSGLGGWAGATEQRNTPGAVNEFGVATHYDRRFTWTWSIQPYFEGSPVETPLSATIHGDWITRSIDYWVGAEPPGAVDARIYDPPILEGVVWRPSPGVMEYTLLVDLKETVSGDFLFQTAYIVNCHFFLQIHGEWTYMGEGHRYTLAGGFDYTPTPDTEVAAHGPEHLVRALNLGPTLPLRGEVRCSDPTLNNDSGRAVDTVSGFVRMHGQPHNLTLEWTGNSTTDYAFYPSGGEITYANYPLNIRPTLFPSAEPIIGPEWAAMVKAEVRDYETHDLIDATIVHQRLNVWNGGGSSATVEDTFGSGSGSVFEYPFPIPGGFAYYIDTQSIDEGNCSRSSPSATLHSVGAPAVTTEPTATGGIFEPFGLYTVPFAGVNPVGSTNSFFIDPGWANAFPVYLRSQNRNIRFLRFTMTPTFEVGTMEVAASKLFTLFDTAAAWAVPHGPAFYTANPNISSTTSIVAAGGTTRIIHAVAGARALVRHSGHFRPFAHRYYTIRYLAQNTGDRFRFGLGRLTFGSEAKYYWRYAWEWTAPASGLQQVTIDLMEPTHKASVNSGTGVVTVTRTVEQIHPGTFLEGSAYSTTAWIEILTLCQTDFDWIEGFFETSGIRTPALLYHGMQVRGDVNPLPNYEATASAGVAPILWRYVANGARGFTIIGTGNIAGVWSILLTYLSDGTGGSETGFLFTSGTSPLRDNSNIDHSEDWTHWTTGPFGEELTPGTPVAVRARRRVQNANNIPGFYGMGDPVTGVYSKTNVLRSLTLLRGEARGVIPGNAGGSPISMQDREGGAILDSDVTDDDGAFRLFGHYGTRTPKENAVSGIDPAAYTLVGGEPVYTPQGELMDWHVVDIGSLGDWVDPELDATILDGFASWLSPLLKIDIVDGLDIANTPGGIHITKLVGAEIQVQNSYDRGFSWETVVVADVGDEDSLPTIYWDPQTTFLHILFHSATDVLGYRSRDNGASWELYSDSLGASAKWPRGCWTPEAHYLAVWFADAILVYRTVFDGASGYALETTIPGVPEQVPELIWDQWDRLHVLYHADDDVVYRLTRDRGSWQGAVVVTTGARLPVTMGEPGGTMVMVYTTAGALIGLPTEADVITLQGGSFTLPDLGEEPQYVGLSFDHFGVAWLVVKLVGGTSSIRWSKDRGVSWNTL